MIVTDVKNNKDFWVTSVFEIKNGETTPVFKICKNDVMMELTYSDYLAIISCHDSLICKLDVLCF